MRYLIIGLGIYGTNLARDLTDMGHQVIGVDIKSSATEVLKDYISAVYIIDTTVESALDALPLKTVNLVIVAIGENFGASVKTVALLKKRNIQHIYARAIDEIHRSILESFQIERIITPEQRAAHDLAYEMMFGSEVTTMLVDSDNIIVKFKAPQYFCGESYSSIGLDNYGLTLIAATRPHEHTNILNLQSEKQVLLDTNAQDAVVASGDIFTCIGTRSAFRTLMRRTT